MSGFLGNISSIANTLGSDISSLAGTIQNAIALPNPAQIAIEITQIFTYTITKIDDAITYPKASMFGSIVNLTVGNRSAVVIAAQAILVVEATLALTRYADQIKTESIKIAHYFEGKYPLALSWLRQKDSHAPESQKSVRVKIICDCPLPMAKNYLQTERVAKSAKRILWKSLKLTGTVFRIGGCLFINPISKNFIVSSVFSNLIKVYERLKKNPPEQLLKSIEANALKVDSFLNNCGFPINVTDLTKALRKQITTLSEHEPKIKAVTAQIQYSAFTVMNMVTGSKIAPLGLPSEIPHGHTRNTCPPRKTPSSRYYSEIE